jgi:conjugal transfer pilus assembly protein TraL
MNSPTVYRVINHLDEPLRFLTLTLDELVIASVSLLLLIVSNHKITVAILSALLFSSLRVLKRGYGPRFLLFLAYKRLPSFVTSWFLLSIPASHWRVWKA